MTARGAAAAITGALTVAALAYTATALVCVARFARRRDPAPRRTPTITVLKPLHGADPALAQRLRVFCEQDYPEYEVIFGARDPDDPALAAAREVAAAYPGVARVVAGHAAPRRANPKADTLGGFVDGARGEIIAIVDADMGVDPTWLRAVAAAFDDPKVGAATCLYRGKPLRPGLASTLGAMYNTEQYPPSVLVAAALGPIRYTFGSTMAVRADVFRAIGGLDAIADHVADDAILGERVAALGRRVALLRFVVETAVDEPSLATLWRHELRWARTHRILRPAGYAGLVVTYPIAVSLAHLVVARRRRPALLLAAAALALRVALGETARGALRARDPRPWPLVVVRDVLGALIWAASYGSRGVAWSSGAYRIEPGGRLVPR